MMRKTRIPQDRTLGMDREISRRDFLHGTAIGGAGLLGAALLPDFASGGSR